MTLARKVKTLKPGTETASKRIYDKLHEEWEVDATAEVISEFSGWRHGGLLYPYGSWDHRGRVEPEGAGKDEAALGRSQVDIPE